ncbi:hypothetical protein AB0D49_21570 [Streptomyces sp. NPDC048290]|uniref:hypothetical protein n=1 Tax=Streptomyces sp. NPDC048290 TaxID=3155811 RepID=UPI00343EA8E6
MVTQGGADYLSTRGLYDREDREITLVRDGITAVALQEANEQGDGPGTGRSSV